VALQFRGQRTHGGTRRGDEELFEVYVGQFPLHEESHRACGGRVTGEIVAVEVAPRNAAEKGTRPDISNGVHNRRHIG